MDGNALLFKTCARHMTFIAAEGLDCAFDTIHLQTVG